MTAFVIWFIGFPVMLDISVYLNFLMTETKQEIPDWVILFWFFMGIFLFVYGLIKKGK